MSEPVAMPQCAAAHEQQSEAQRTAAPERNAVEGDEAIAIPFGGSFVGLLSFRGEASVLGALQGNIRASGKLRIGPDARVEARIDVDEVLIEGLVRGDVFARARVELAATAKVEGAIHAPRIQLRDGCSFSGLCESGDLSETPDLPT